ncbi:GNAT family N-acetyltransferase [Deinococcus sp. HMF7604]|uniref:GNAT family N-acetyltransferase n=1 Tax=Deinococcus betulae TaxID=2873312 RepID=UPI001CCF21F7|nr:GNAT family N-acetyltransferase [Deinococcus betulae]MBZ9751208.1 GNAT family N-acetyltransferase [Deinococcus betulae]
MLRPVTPVLPAEVRTPRLWLRRPDPADAPALVSAVNASLPELRPWMHWAQAPQTLEGALENLRAAAERFESRETLRYHIWNPAGTELLGSSGFHALDWRVPKGEIGYWVATAHTGQGYAEEVARALTALALGGLGFRRLEIRCDPANSRSARIPAALGYRLDAQLVNDDVCPAEPGRLRDTLVFSRVQ